MLAQIVCTTSMIEIRVGDQNPIEHFNAPIVKKRLNDGLSHRKIRAASAGVVQQMTLSYTDQHGQPLTDIQNLYHQAIRAYR